MISAFACRSLSEEFGLLFLNECEYVVLHVRDGSKIVWSLVSSGVAKWAINEKTRVLFGLDHRQQEAAVGLDR